MMLHGAVGHYLTDASERRIYWEAVLSVLISLCKVRSTPSAGPPSDSASVISGSPQRAKIPFGPPHSGAHGKAAGTEALFR